MRESLYVCVSVCKCVCVCVRVQTGVFAFRVVIYRVACPFRCCCGLVVLACDSGAYGSGSIGFQDLEFWGM